jgi:peroxisomal 3,2-trans-enoyl-CoA isomerase
MLETFIGKYIDFPKILIAFINGPAVGISVSTLGLFDGVYSSSRATFSLPFTRTAQSAEGCSSFVFPSLMGSLHAKELLLFDRKLTAQEAQQRGLVTKVIDEANFEEEKTKICQDILSLPKGSLLTSKLIMQKWTKDTLHQVNKYEVEMLKQRWLTEEFVQAMMEFMRGRKKTKN